MLGIGNDLNGDDGAGCAIADELLRTRTPQKQSNYALSVYNCGTVPENFVGKLRKIQPDFVLLIDSGDFSASPGTIRLFSPEESVGFSFATHALPLNILASYIEAETKAKAALLLIQPEQVSYLSPISFAVQQSVERIIDFFNDFENKLNRQTN